MIRSLGRLVAVAGLSLVAAACASTSPGPGVEESEIAPGGHIEQPVAPAQCVPFARVRSGISIFGDAWTWWNQAAGRYTRSPDPKPGAVLVLDGYAGSERAHLAVVRALISPREIHVDHANWLNSGAIYLDDAVADVSPDNDWSLVKVFNLTTGTWGTHVYTVRGFIGPDNDPLRMAKSGQ